MGNSDWQGRPLHQSWLISVAPYSNLTLSAYLTQRTVLYCTVLYIDTCTVFLELFSFFVFYKKRHNSISQFVQGLHVTLEESLFHPCHLVQVEFLQPTRVQRGQGVELRQRCQCRVKESLSGSTWRRGQFGLGNTEDRLGCGGGVLDVSLSGYGFVWGLNIDLKDRVLNSEIFSLVQCI